MLVFSSVLLTGFWIGLLTALMLYSLMRSITVLPAYKRCEALYFESHICVEHSKLKLCSNSAQVRSQAPSWSS